MNEVPNFESLLNKYHNNLLEIYKRGYDVPNMTIERVWEFEGENVVENLHTSKNKIIGI